MSDTRLTVGQKIQKLRKNKKLSKNKLAHDVIFRSNSYFITKIEEGNAEYTEDQLRLIKEFFDIEGMPLADDECDSCRNFFYLIRDHALEDHANKAREKYITMAKIVNLEPCDDYLPMLYRLLDILDLFRNKAKAKS